MITEVHQQSNAKTPPPGQPLKEHSSMVENETSIFTDKIQIKVEEIIIVHNNKSENY